MPDCRLLRLTVRHMSRGIMTERKEKPFTVFVEGNIGSGKTTFLNHFQKSNALVLSEPVEMWRNAKGHNLLGLMYEDPLRWGLTFQSYVQLTMMNLHTQSSAQPLKIMERSLFSARYCFVENLARQGLMPPCELTVLDEWFKWIVSHMDIAGDLIVYLRTEPEVVHERVKARARKEENCVSLEYLKQLHKLHEDWLLNTTTPMIVLDANRDLPEMQDEFCRYKSMILQKAAGNSRKESLPPSEQLPSSKRPGMFDREQEVPVV